VKTPSSDMKVDEAFGDYHILSDEGTIRLSGKVLI
jgi:hypothetical protein